MSREILKDAVEVQIKQLFKSGQITDHDDVPYIVESYLWKFGIEPSSDEIEEIITNAKAA